MKEIKFRVIDSAGNITLLVTTPVEQKDYQHVSDALLSHEEFGGEQVGFVVDKDTMNMAGLEFCGNASRSFGLYKACEEGLSGPAEVTINVSGVPYPLTVQVDPAKMYTKIRMPDLVSIDSLSGCPLPGTEGSPVAVMDGIVHVIARGISPTRENFDIIKDHIKKTYSPAAMGVMFIQESPGSALEAPEEVTMTPVVHVFDVDTTFFEGSCGSGTTALCGILSLDKGPGTHQFNIHQPAGTILATGTVSGPGSAEGTAEGIPIEGITIEGPVSISEEKTITLD